LFSVENPDGDKEKSFLEFINPDSLKTITAKVEPHLKTLTGENRFQFERIGYFVADRHDYSSEKPVFNRVVALRDSWKKVQKKQPTPPKEGKKKSAKTSSNADGANVADLISIDQFFKCKLVTAKVVEGERVEGADRLLKLQVEIDGTKRQVVAGIAKWYSPEDLIGKNVVIVANLKPAKIFGIESNGMILAAKSGKKKLTVITTDDPDFATGGDVG
jgi:methionyl-tRNA synthetase